MPTAVREPTPEVRERAEDLGDLTTNISISVPHSLLRRLNRAAREEKRAERGCNGGRSEIVRRALSAYLPPDPAAPAALPVE